MLSEHCYLSALKESDHSNRVHSLFLINEHFLSDAQWLYHPCPKIRLPLRPSLLLRLRLLHLRGLRLQLQLQLRLNLRLILRSGLRFQLQLQPRVIQDLILSLELLVQLQLRPQGNLNLRLYSEARLHSPLKLRSRLSLIICSNRLPGSVLRLRRARIAALANASSRSQALCHRSARQLLSGKCELHSVHCSSKDVVYLPSTSYAQAWT